MGYKAKEYTIPFERLEKTLDYLAKWPVRRMDPYQITCRKGNRIAVFVYPKARKGVAIQILERFAKRQLSELTH